MRSLPAAFVFALLVGCDPPAARPEPKPSATPPPPVRPFEESVPPPAKAVGSEAHDEPLTAYVSPPGAPYVPGTPPRTPAHVPGPTPEDEKECKARGGKIQAVCMLGTLECVIRHRDGGKRCTDKSQCAGECLYEGPHPAPARAAGVCERTSDPCGCKARVIAGNVQPTICGD